MQDYGNSPRIDPRATFSRSDTASSGDWNASTNAPGLADGSGTANQYYRVSVAGTQDLGSGSITYAVGDYVKYSGSVWFKTTQPIGVTYWSNEKHLSSENILLQSQTLNTTWAAVDIADPTGSQTAPDGTSTAWLLTADSASSQSPYVRQSPTFSGSTQYTMVAHLKAGTASHSYISFRTQNGYSAYALLDFSGGTVSHAGFGDFTGVTSSVTALGSSWFKVTLNATTGTNLSGSNVLVGISDGTTPTSAGYATWTSAGETMYAWGIQLATTNAKVYDSPTTTQISRSYAPKLKSVATAGQPRFEYDPSTDGQSAGTSLGILIEGEATNLSRYGSALASWANLSLNARVESNVAIAPSGLLEADLIGSSNTTSATRYAGDYSISLTSGTTYTASVYLKAAGHRYAQLCGISTGWATSDLVNYDLQTGTVTAGGSATGTLTDVGNGWFRATATMTANGTTSGSFLLAIVSSLSDYRLKPFTGDEYAGILAWGFQTEASNFASSLVDTGTGSSQLTRALESLSMTDSSLFDNGEGTIVAEFALPSGPTADQATTVTGAVVGITASTSNNYVRLQTDTRTNVYSASMYADGSSQLTISSAGDTGGQFVKKALSFKQNDTTLCRNGTLSTTDTNCVTPSGLQTIQFGAVSPSYTGATASGHYKRVAIYNEALSANLQALTS